MVTVNLLTTSAANWIFQRLKFFANEKGTNPAQIFADDGSSWTFEELFQNSVHVAAGLKSVGIHPGDMASVVARNTHELHALVFGCVMSGVTVTPSIAKLRPNELKQNFLVVNPTIVIAAAPYIPAVKEALIGFNPEPKVLEVQQLFRDAVAKGSHADPNAFKPIHIDDPKSHILTCMFSSGTTGKPKAAAISDYGMMNTVELSSVKGATSPICNISQINWTSWWFIVFRSLITGSTRIIMDEDSPVSILEATRKFKPSMISGSPWNVGGVANELEANPSRWDLSSVRALFLGGDICNKVAHEDLVKRLGVPVYQIYGSTEAGAILRSPVGSPIVYGSAGKPFVQIKLVEWITREEITEPNRCGEILVKCPMFRHYVNNPEATKAAFDENGWFKMGDVAHFDEAGNYFIVDRAKEMFKYCGYHIAPSEIEDIIRKIPGVKDVGVAGKFQGIDVGELPTAFVVKSTGANVSEQDIHDYLAKFDLHDSKKLRGGVIFRDEIPRNTNGKLIRSKLRALLNESQT